MPTRRTTTKDIALLLQLESSKQLALAPEFQRNSVWPRPAKAYLIDTILADRPIPPLFFSRTVNAQTGTNSYQVVDGQQRLRAVLEFIRGRFSLTQSAGRPWEGKRWATLSEDERTQIFAYDFVVEELQGYKDNDIRDMFARINRYVVPLNAQERRRAQYESAFIVFAEEIAQWPFWIQNRVFSANAANRLRIDEFVEELAILLLEGPQDKKSSIDLYINKYDSEFEFAEDVRSRLTVYLEVIAKSLPDLQRMQLRRPVHIYALIGALDLATDSTGDVADISTDRLGVALTDFDAELGQENASKIVAFYERAASRQTDNIGPRETRIGVLERIVSGAV